MRMFFRYAAIASAAVPLVIVGALLALPSSAPASARPADATPVATPAASLYLPDLRAGLKFPDPPGQWTRYTLPGGSPKLNKIVMSNSSLGWAVGAADGIGAVWRFNGERWNQETIPAVGELTDVSVVSPFDIWVVGTWHPNVGVVLHWDGSAWSEVPQPEPLCTHEAVLALSASDVWLTSLCARSDIIDGIYHWDGSTWTLTCDTRKYLTPIAFASTAPTDVWAVTGGTTTYHWDGVTWHLIGSPSPTGITDGISMSTPTDGWMADGHAFCSYERYRPECESYAWLVHWDGTRWVDHTFFSDHAALDVKAISPSLAWAVGGVAGGHVGQVVYTGSLDVWDGQKWSLVATGPNARLDHLSVLGTNDIWATGSDGAVYHYPAY